MVLVRYYGGNFIGCFKFRKKAYIKVFTEAMNQAKKLMKKELPIYKLEISNKDYSRLLKALSSDDIVVSKRIPWSKRCFKRLLVQISNNFLINWDVSTKILMKRKTICCEHIMHIMCSFFL